MARNTTFGDVVTGTLAGMAGGAFASWVMNKYMAAQQQQQDQLNQQARRRREESRTRAKGGRKRAKSEGGGDGASGGEDATVKTAEAISRNLFEHELSDSEKQDFLERILILDGSPRIDAATVDLGAYESSYVFVGDFE